MAKIGVFDSGVGGLSVARAIQKALPGHEVMYLNDKQHVPYGDKPLDMVYGFALPILRSLEAQGCEVIVIACNTVSTNLIDRLRQDLHVPLLGMEPMVEAAANATKTGVIAICATPATLASSRYHQLKNTFAHDKKVLEPDCSTWAYMIEHNQINTQKIAAQIEDVCQQGADVIVLGCTHYHWIEEEIKAMAAGRALVLQPEPATIERLKNVLSGAAS